MVEESAAAHSTGRVRRRDGGAVRRRGGRFRWVVALTTVATVLVGGGAAAALGASTPDADLLSDDFSQGMGQWSTSGGDWRVDQDGRLRQNQVGPDNARATAGSTQWTDYAAQSRVQPTEFGADGAFAGISVRATEATTFARLVLVAAGRAEVQVVSGGQVSVVASGPAVVTPGVWHTLRLEGRGESLKGYVDGNPVSPTGPGGTVGLSPTGQIGLQTAQAAATFDDIRVTGLNGTDSGSTPTQTATTTRASELTTSALFESNSGPATDWNPPANISEALAKVWAHQESTYNNGDLYAFKNYLWDQIMAAQGNINYCVRWESDTPVTAEQRDQVQAQLQRQFQLWMNTMTENGQGWNGWPYPQVNVKVVGWAVTDRNLLKWDDNSVDIYVGDIGEGAPQCTPPCGRFFHQNNDYSGCPGGAGHHYDMSLWLTDGFGGGHGGDWGQRIGREHYMDNLNADSVYVLLHEMGHSFGLDDFYDWDPGVGGFIMKANTSAQITEFDKWMLRDWWRHLKGRYGL